MRLTKKICLWIHPRKMSSNKKAYLFAGLAVFFWSTVATAFKIALREFDFIQLIFYASGVTVVLLFFVLLFQKKLHLIFRQTSLQWRYSLLMGAFNPLLYYLVLFKAYSLLPAQVAQPLNMIWPITLALLSVPLLKQKIGWISVGALFVSFTGVFYIVAGKCEWFWKYKFHRCCSCRKQFGTLVALLDF